MSELEYKPCPICGEEYLDYQFEEVFTGRIQRICFKCYRQGRRITGEIGYKHKSERLRKGEVKK